MSKRKEIFLLFLLDFLAISVAWCAYYWFRIQSGWFTISLEPDFWMPMLVVTLYWHLLFFFFGLYRSWYRQSRFDELALIFKAATFGVLLLFFLVFIDDKGVGSTTTSRLYIFVYWVFIFLFTTSGRLFSRFIQQRLLVSGIGRRNAIIVGNSEQAKELFQQLNNNRGIGLEVVGFVAIEDSEKNISDEAIKILGTVKEISTIIEQYSVKEILIALDSTQHDKLLEVLTASSPYNVQLKIIPDLYDIISGQARTIPIHGFPLIEIMPELMQPWEKVIKRSFDIVFSFVILLVAFPFLLFVGILIKLTSKGTILYSQERVGKDGKHFHIFKFRTMYEDAEKKSGPVWAGKDDPRITPLGNVLRKARIDEIPQLINVLDGDMSLVGPRPERPFFVEQLSHEIPLYSRRLKVRPGITGWAQVKHKYDESIEDVKKKVEYDLYYIENMSLRLDIKILLNTISVVLLGKGH